MEHAVKKLLIWFTLPLLLLAPLAAWAGTFTWIPPHGALPTEAACLATILSGGNSTATEGVSGNTPYNSTVIPKWDLANFYANGNGAAGTVVPNTYYSNVSGDLPTLMYAQNGTVPTTDETIDFYACKWGLDPDVYRAEAWEESTWNAETLGDLHTVLAECTQPTYNFFALWNGTNCHESEGIIQQKVFYYIYEHPWDLMSTSFALDVRGAIARGAINGDMSAYFTNNGTDNPAAGHNHYLTDVGNCSLGTSSYCTDLYDGAIATWFSGAWWDGTSNGATGCLTTGSTGAVGYWYDCVNPFVSSKPWPGGL